MNTQQTNNNDGETTQLVSVATITKSRGRPAEEVKFPGEPFTFKQLRAKNRRLSNLTLRNRIYKGLEKGFIQKLNDTIKSGKVGKPQHTYVYVMNSTNNA